ncbi:hypothetical protein [Allokutzneria sp. NRRL B-24872]|uniref:hypothetical protein n=1 Tax=Allokutzneria sp. NRRL B-24872 TaxID=1137961 RepID=UPI00143CEE7A|nr:hypothetical protein [Allokutzneria sp. NRRL B-24872]
MLLRDFIDRAITSRPSTVVLLGLAEAGRIVALEPIATASVEEPNITRAAHVSDLGR